MRFGTVLTDRLADLELAEAANQPRAEQQSQAESGEAGEGRSRRDVAEDAKRAEVFKELFVEKMKKHCPFVLSFGPRFQSASRSFIRSILCSES